MHSTMENKMHTRRLRTRPPLWLAVWLVVRGGGPAQAACRALRRLAPLLAASALMLLAACGKEAEPLWLQGRADPLSQADAQRGRKVIERYGCVACHVIPGVRGPASSVGPPLAHMAARAYVGGVLPNTPDNLVRWLRDPPAADPRTAMPDMGLDAAEAKDVAAYLYTLD